MVYKYTMSKFIKLSNVIINSNSIYKIVIRPKIYDIYFMKDHISGYHILSIGSISSTEYTHPVYEEREPEDYKMITEWISKL